METKAKVVSFVLLQLSSLDSTEDLWGAERPSGRSRTALRCSSGFWLNTTIKKEEADDKVFPNSAAQ